MKIESEVLRRLGPVPFWRGEKRCLSELDRIYRAAMEAARQSLGYDYKEKNENRNLRG